MRRRKKGDADDAVEKGAFLRLLSFVDIRGDDQLLDHQPAEAVTDKNDGRAIVTQIAVDQ